MRQAEATRRAPCRWVALGACLMGVMIGLVPLETFIQIGTWVTPLRSLQDKTILLFQVLKITLPLCGIAGICWLAILGRGRQVVVSKLKIGLAGAPWAMPGILALTLALHLGWILYYPTRPYADSIWYFEKGAELASGQGYIYDAISRKPTAAWPVGYPAFLGLLFLVFGPQTMVARLANAALAMLIVYLTYRIAKRLFTPEVAIVSAFLMATLPGFVVYSSLVCSDILFMALVLACLSLTLQTDDGADAPGKRALLRAFLTGLLSGAMTLTRSTGLALVPFWVVIRWLAVHRTSRSRALLWRWAGALGIGTCLVVLPWTLRNYLHFHRVIVVSTNGGVNFWIGNNPLAYGGFVFPRDAASNPLLPLIGDEIAVDETGYRLGFDFIHENPVQALKLLPAKLFYLYNSNDAGLEWNRRSALVPNQSGSEMEVSVLINAVYTLLVLLALLGLIALRFCAAPSRPLVWIGLIVGAYWTLVHLPFFGTDRFALPILPFLCMYAACGLLALLEPV